MTPVSPKKKIENFSLSRYYHLLRSLSFGRFTYLIFFVTAQCNARCRMCFYWKEIDAFKERGLLSIREIERITKGFKNLAYISLAGGEPTLRDDLDEIIHLFYKNSSSRYVNFTTNGLLPQKTAEIAYSVLTKCPDILLKINLSIDHIGEKHDHIRAVPGNFNKMVQTLSKLNELKKKHKNLVLVVSSVLNSYNKDDMKTIIDYVKNELKPDAHSIGLARGNAREPATKDVTIPEYEAIMKYLYQQNNSQKGLMQVLLNMMMEINSQFLATQKMVLPCVAGRRILTITDDGLVVPCEMLKQLKPDQDFVMGDLRRHNYDINSILKTQKYRQIIEHIHKTRCACTFECAALWNITLNPLLYPKILCRLFS
ncbi:MAG: radical SAM protein [Candidatus Omnitrophica bacterium]|nr:radical SAM protein [Candidatus Omnitrophota bacterium]